MSTQHLGSNYVPTCIMMTCLLNIWGVIMFLRVSWLVGQSGILLALLTVVLGNIVTTITSLSMSAVATNGRIQAGGVYYMISRSLGPEFGGSIGLMFTLANSIASATYIIGFTDSLKDLMYYYFDGAKIIDGAVNDTRIVGTVTLIGVLGLAIVGMDWVTRVQMGLLLLLIGSQVDFVVGAIMGPQGDDQEAQGFIGINSELFSRNMGPDYRKFEGNTQGFFSVFGVFFTAVTGIVAGANLSGDLKDPAVAIPKGTLAAIATTFVSYIIFPVLIGAAAMRDASGNTTLYQLYRNQTMEDPDTPYNFWENPVFTSESCSKTGGTDENMKEPCEFGMQNSFQVMELMAAWGPLIYAGCFAATLSSAIGSLVGAPRVLQALAKDKLYPGIYLFSKGSGANNDPVRGYVLVFIISFVCIMLGDLNLVSTLLSNFFLASYSLINFSCFHASLIKSPGWRPGFKYYNLWISLVGGILCLIVMFLIDWVTALVTFIITIALYLYVSYRNPDVNWGSSTQAQTYVSALNSTLDLNMVEEHVKNYRPQLLVLSGEVRSRPPLLHLAHLLTKNISLLICGHVIQTEPSQRVRNSLSKQSYTWFTKHKIRAFYSVVEGMTLEHGAKSLCKLVGLGKLKPNTVLLGFKSNWRKCDKNELRAYFNTLHEALDMYSWGIMYLNTVGGFWQHPQNEALDMHMALMILRVPQGLDYSQITEDEELLGNTEHYGTTLDNTKNMTVKDGTDSESSTPPSSPKLDCGGVVGAGGGTEDTAAPGGAEEDGGDRRKHRLPSMVNLYRGPGGSELSKDVLNNITMFMRKQRKGTIDVWWLYDDGGLTLLVPYILSTRSQWSQCKLRVFALANRKDELDIEQRSMANLLAKFRIDYSDVIVIPDVAKKAQESSKLAFDQLIENFKAPGEISEEDEGVLISEAELLGQREKTNRHIRLKELLVENSKDSSLIVMTLPMPRKTSVSALLYMAWLDTLTSDLPPFILIRGNQTSVLTYYS